MTDWIGVFFGLFVVLVGVLSVMNHPIVDGFNRWAKSIGTTRRPRRIEMSDTSILVGRFMGAVLILLGLAILATVI